MSLRVFSLGHSNRAFSEFLQKLQEHKIDLVVDVRTFPRSRRFPHFNRKNMESELSRHSIEYSFKGENLGGYGENVDYEETIDELADMSRDINLCLVCSEANYKDCHRHTMLEPSFNERGVEVKHIKHTHFLE